MPQPAPAGGPAVDDEAVVLVGGTRLVAIGILADLEMKIGKTWIWDDKIIACDPPDARQRFLEEVTGGCLSGWDDVQACHGGSSPKKVASVWVDRA